MGRFKAVVAAAFVLTAAASARAEVVVCGPGSMNDALAEVAEKAALAGLPFKAVIGHSPAQARQIAEGAPCDIFISADAQWMDFLQAKDFLAAGGAKALASTHLVLVVPVGSPLLFTGRPGESLALSMGEGRLAMADPDMVPAGRMAVSALQVQGSWPGVSGRLALTQNVRAVAALVERGEAPAGIAFSSDVAGDAKLRTAFDFSDGGAPPVRFPMAVIKGRDSPEVRRLYAYLSGAEALASLKVHGFSEP
ncbi:MAG TPA: molybdate ABC transporter substrate-binding protein [Candidatus Sulfotelmatobacter sp.]|nr:molybdate ABC transporter substrate-binding protein [Candidatus Sulfotelmatobacter sp.]